MTKNAQNVIKLESEEKKAVERDAKALNMTLSEYTRWLYRIGRYIVWSLDEKPKEKYLITAEKIKKALGD